MVKSSWALAIIFFMVGFMLSWLITSASLVSGITGSVIGYNGIHDQLSPSNRVFENQIQVFDDKVVIDVSGAQWARFTDTNSMDPTLDIGANALQLIPQSPSEIKVGDIISFTNSDNEKIIHRVIYKGVDEKGTYFITKGDNNVVSDRDSEPTKILQLYLKSMKKNFDNEEQIRTFIVENFLNR